MQTQSHSSINFRSNKGFTLLEVLVCVAILASIIMSMFAVYTHLTLEIRRSRNRTIATQAAQMIMETVIASPYDARVFHNLSSSVEPPSDSPVLADVLAWRNTLASFPIAMGAQVRVEEVNAPFCHDPDDEEELALCPRQLQVTVEIHYQDHGREATQELSLTLEPK